MGSDYSDDGRRSRRRKHEDDANPKPDYDRRRRHRDDESDKYKRRHRSRSWDKAQDKDEDRSRARSRTPESRKRRSRDRERESDRGRDRERDRERRRDSPSDRRLGRHRDRSEDRERQDGSDGGRRDHRRRRRSPEVGSSRPKSRKVDSSRYNTSEGGDGGRSLFKRSGPLPSQDDSFAISKGEEPEKPKEQPNFGNTGLLAAASNSVAQADGSTITLKYHEPAEARKPSPRDLWKLFIFKGSDIMDTIELSTRSCWLVGREMAVVDLPAEHPSISKQHAVIQFRYIEKRNEFGDKIGKVKPYLIDLESANGTSLNGKKVPDSRYLELRNKDMVQFGNSTREYVLMLAPKD